MTLPNFLIIGAHKAGTSSLYHYIREHPDVYMPTLKEARFFAYDENNPDHRRKVPNTYPITTMQAYEALFQDAKNEKAIGEASPEYLNNARAALRIRECLPNAKLIASLRNPVDRTYSEFIMRCRSGNEKRTISEAFQSNERWVQTGLYYEKLKRYMDLYDKGQFEVVLFDDLANDPLSVVQRLFTFLGVDNTYTPHVYKQYNPGGIPKNEILNSFFNMLKNPIIKKSIKLVMPESLLSFGNNIRQRNLAKPTPLPPEIREQMLVVFRDDILRLQELIQRDLSSWLQA